MRIAGDKADLGRNRTKPELEHELVRTLRGGKRFLNEPTPERERHAGAAPRVTRIIPHAGESSPRVHRFEAPLEGLMHKLRAHDYHAADRLRWAEENRTARPRIGDYGDGVGRSDPATRSGVSAVQQRATDRWEFFWPRLSPRTREVLQLMVLRRPNGEAPTVGDAMAWAREFTPTTYDKTAKPVWEVALRLACEILAWVERDYDRLLARRRGEAAERRQRRLHGDAR